MIYAVTTHSFLLVIKLDENLKLKKHRVIDYGHYFGMTFVGNDPQKLLVVCKSRPGQKLAGNNSRTAFMILEPRRQFGQVDLLTIAGQLGDIHQVTYAHGGIYIANTKYNSIVFQGVKEDVRHEYFFENVNYDINHANSIFPCGNQVLVLLHNKGRQTSEVCILEHT